MLQILLVSRFETHSSAVGLRNSPKLVCVHLVIGGGEVGGEGGCVGGGEGGGGLGGGLGGGGEGGGGDGLSGE